MAERWRRPMRFEVIGPSDSVSTLGDDRVFHDPEILISDESWERIKTGYLCLCGEPHERPWPATCPVCGVSRHTVQGEIRMKFTGYIAAGETISDELARLAEENERRKHRPQSRIIVPRGITLD